MKKKLLSLVAATFFGASAFSQSIPNAGFESWTSMGLYDEADSWISLNLMSAFGMPVTLTKSSDAHSGSFAAKLETMVSMDGDTLPGLLMSGNGDFFSGITNHPFASRPERMRFYYKGGPAANDTALVALVLTKWDSGTNTQITVAEGMFPITSIQNSYTLGDLEIIYTSTETPDTVSVIATSSSTNINIPGSTLYLDDITFVMSTADLFNIEKNHSIIYPNPAKDYLKISLNGIQADVIQISDITGKIILNNKIDGENIDVSDLSNGSYFYTLKNKGEFLEQGKFSILK